MMAQSYKRPRARRSPEEADRIFEKFSRAMSVADRLEERRARRIALVGIPWMVAVAATLAVQHLGVYDALEGLAADVFSWISWVILGAVTALVVPFILVLAIGPLFASVAAWMHVRRLTNEQAHEAEQRHLHRLGAQPGDA